MKVVKWTIASMMLLSSSTDLVQAIELKQKSSNKVAYKSDDMDDLIEGIITNKHAPQEKPKEKGPVDRLVQEAYEQALE